MKKLSFFIGIFLWLLNISPVSAQYVVSSPQAVSNLTINKLVQNPQNNQFVKDLCSMNISFLPGQSVTYEIDVTNSGQTQLTNVSVKDVLPNLLDFVSGPGNFDNLNHTLNFNIDSLNVGETKSFQLKAKVEDASKLPDNGPTCLTNTAQAAVNQLFASSSALAPVQKPLAPVQQLPKTGPKETNTILAGSLVFLLASGFLYRKSLKP